LTVIIQSFGYSGVVRISPSRILLSFQERQEQQSIHTLEIPNAVTDVNKLVEVEALVDAVVERRLSKVKAVE
jgi:uncharacterized membrane protein YjjP (DUF1212 family)